MNAMVIYSRDKEETGLLRDVFRRLVGFDMADEWSVRPVLTEQELETVVRDGAIAQICCADIAGVRNGNAAQSVRAAFAEAQLILIVSPSQSPVAYIRPGIMPAGILFKPLSGEMALPLLEEVLKLVRRKTQKDVFHGAVFTVASHGTTYRIPMENILYFEARNKKLYIYTANAEVEFYDTLEHLLERIPEQFLRCHKSFVVNMAAAEQVSLGQNLILMEDGKIQIPISRGYKPAVKEAMA